MDYLPIFIALDCMIEFDLFGVRVVPRLKLPCLLAILPPKLFSVYERSKGGHEKGSKKIIKVLHCCLLLFMCWCRLHIGKIADILFKKVLPRLGNYFWYFSKIKKCWNLKCWDVFIWMAPYENSNYNQVIEAQSKVA